MPTIRLEKTIFPVGCNHRVFEANRRQMSTTCFAKAFSCRGYKNGILEPTRCQLYMIRLEKDIFSWRLRKRRSRSESSTNVCDSLREGHFRVGCKNGVLEANRGQMSTISFEKHVFRAVCQHFLKHVVVTCHDWLREASLVVVLAAKKVGSRGESWTNVRDS